MIVENISDRRLKNVEKELLKQPLLKIRGLDSKRVTSKNYTKGIVFLMNQMLKEDTLYATTDDLNGDFQCSRSSRRSQGDIFLIARYYYPDITFKELRKVLFEAVNNGPYNTSYCTWIEKRVFWRDGLNYPYWAGYITSDYMKDELGFLLKIE